MHLHLTCLLQKRILGIVRICFHQRVTLDNVSAIQSFDVCLAWHFVAITTLDCFCYVQKQAFTHTITLRTYNPNQKLQSVGLTMLYFNDFAITCSTKHYFCVTCSTLTLSI